MKSIYKVKKDRSKYKRFIDLKIGDYLYKITDGCTSIYQIRKIEREYFYWGYKLFLYFDTIIGEYHYWLKLNINRKHRSLYDGYCKTNYWTSDKRVFLNKLKYENI